MGQDPDPTNRRLSFREIPATIRKALAKYGCAVGSLLQGLNKAVDVEAYIANKTIRTQIDWVTEQIRLMGKSNANGLAHYLFPTIQGGCLLANSMQTAEMLHRQLNRLKRALDQEEDLTDTSIY